MAMKVYDLKLSLDRDLIKSVLRSSVQSTIFRR